MKTDTGYTPTGYPAPVALTTHFNSKHTATIVWTYCMDSSTIHTLQEQYNLHLLCLLFVAMDTNVQLTENTGILVQYRDTGTLHLGERGAISAFPPITKPFCGM